MSSTHMDEFEKLVKKRRKTESEQDIYNASRSHALVLFRELLDVAKKQKDLPVRVVSGRFDMDFYNELAKDVKEVLANGNSVKAICLDPSLITKCNQFANAISESENGELLVANHSIKSAHFILVGDKSYRLELDDTDAKAVANFNNDTIGKFLSELFDSLADTLRVGTESPQAATK